MIDRLKNKYGFDAVCILIIVLLFFYSISSKDILDYIYLAGFCFYYLEIKYYRWKKYH